MKRLHRIGWVLSGFVSYIALCTSQRCDAQLVVESWTVYHLHGTQRVITGPDPTAPSDLLKVLYERQIQRELAMSPEQLRGILVLENRRANLKRENSSKRRVIDERMEELKRAARVEDPQNARPSLEIEQLALQLNMLGETSRQLTMQGIEELLQPGQMERLYELSYRIEIAYVGYADAIVTGRLSDRVGVFENQVTHFRKRIEDFESKAEEKKMEVKSEAEKLILDLLTDAQRRMAVKQLGMLIDFQPLTIEQDERNKVLNAIKEMQDSPQGPTTTHRKAFLPIRVIGTSLPNPTNRRYLLDLLSLPHIQSEIGFSKEKIAVLRSIILEVDKNRNAILRAQPHGIPLEPATKLLLEAHKRQATSDMEALLTDAQFSRLQELAYQIEVAVMGLPKALEVGFLGKSIEITKDQKELIARETPAIFAAKEEESRKINESLEEQVFAELSPEQRSKLKTAIGKYFEYKVRPGVEAAMEWHSQQEQLKKDDGERSPAIR